MKLELIYASAIVALCLFSLFLSWVIKMQKNVIARLLNEEKEILQAQKHLEDRLARIDGEFKDLS